MKGSKIWGSGLHHLWVNGKPTWVYVSDEALKKDYNILKANLPIPIGIDHLKEEILQQNKILQKMDPLNVGVIEDVELTNDGIRIVEGKFTNPTIQELHDKKELPSWSVVTEALLKKCESGKADYIEDYGVIKRVDLVEKGACTTCNLEYINNELIEAKSIIGDIMAEDGNNEGDGQNQDPTLNDVMKGITDLKEEQKNQFDGLDERIKALEDNNFEGSNPEGEVDGEGETVDPRIEAMEAQIADMKAEAAKKEATGLVNGYIEAGKILPKQVEQHVSLALAEPEQYQKMMAEAPVLVDTSGKTLADIQAGGDGGSDNKLSQYEQENDIDIEEMCAEDAGNEK